MILKELDPFSSEDKYQKAGRNAEESISFYLKRFFEDEENILVLNGIRWEVNDDAAQIDHLIIHEYGVILIECKSVSGKIQLLDDGQWVRWYNDKSQGMKSPVTQVKMQAAFFKKQLSKAVKQEGFFNNIPFDTLVALSDQGHFIPPKNSPRPNEVCKADQVADKVNELVKQYKEQQEKPVLSKNNLNILAKYLIASHKPLNTSAAPQKEEKVEIHVEEAAAAPINKLTTAKLAELKGMKTNSLTQLLIDAGYLELKNKLTYLTESGKKSGGEWRKGFKGGGFYFLWPSDLALPEQKIAKKKKWWGV
ncbi:NERD domain-containing protein [Methylobacillus caricis]|uniref:nuclease-related domain-containing protein n=1 Tax=Methylobacillus caricis TaxID=1971611 RepID=UPI001CFF7001|nr:nuclease-related domain-containing protein [Methylobacillus caricis]MCB5187577.1 NERD domain-containing protein [Methylobacillus caricis]